MSNVQLIKCNSCMQTLESKIFENHVKECHFDKVEKYSISEKNSSSVLDTPYIIAILSSFKITTYINNQFYKLSKQFKEKFFVPRRSLSSNKLSERSSYNHPTVKKHIKIVSNKGTSSYVISYPSKIGFFHQSSSIKSITETQPTVKLVCNTCKRELDLEICRILITRNIDKCPQFFSFHFFSPCWNFEDFCKKHPDLFLDRMLFSISKNIPMSENGIKDLQSNLSFWN